MTPLVSRGYTFWNYVPSLAAAVIFLLVFIVLTGFHTWSMARSKTWFCIAFTLGGVFECIGYIGRCIAHSNTTTMGPYILTNIFTLLGPTLFAASIYMTLGRLIRCVHAEHLSVIKISRLTKTFVWGDVLSFLVQGSSSSLSVLGYTVGAKVVVITGLVIQLVSFSIFWLTAIVFERRIRRSPTSESLQTDIPWKKFLYMLYGVSSLIIIRSAFRVAEYALGNSGYPLKHEWTLYVFDSVPMAIVMFIFFVWYPSVLKIGADRESKLPLANWLSAIEARARDARLWLQVRPEQEIFVVTHGGILHSLTGDWEDCCKHEATGWSNTEYRTYEFESNGLTEDPRLLEASVARHRRGKISLQPTYDEQVSLHEARLRI